MSSLCRNHFLQQLYRKIDGEYRLFIDKSPIDLFRSPPSGAVLWSQNERNLDCVVTFQTHSILQRFMLRFDMLQLDCNDHLYIYDGSHAVGTHKVSSKIGIPIFLFEINPSFFHPLPPYNPSVNSSFHFPCYYSYE